MFEKRREARRIRLAKEAEDREKAVEALATLIVQHPRAAFLIGLGILIGRSR